MVSVNCHEDVLNQDVILNLGRKKGLQGNTCNHVIRNSHQQALATVSSTKCMYFSSISTRFNPYYGWNKITNEHTSQSTKD